jgi:hypothetical protein
MMEERNTNRMGNRRNIKKFHRLNQDKKGIQYFDDDWMYRPLLNIDTRTNYDGNKIEAEWMSSDP